MVFFSGDWIVINPQKPLSSMTGLHHPLRFLISGGICFSLLIASKAFSQDLYVGSNSSSQSTNLSDGSTYSYGNTYVGYNSGDTNNQLSVGNSPTLLTNSGDLYIGYAGSLNSMLITNGGAVANNNGWVGYTNTASNNLVLVSDGGSTWTSAGDLTVGVDGSGNSLVVSNGASVAVTGSTYGIAIGLNSNSSNNSILVTGANSTGATTLNSEIDIIIGNYGSGNSLTIASDTSGGTAVVSAIGNVVLGAQLGSLNNRLLIDGSNSTLTTLNLTVGSNGSANSLILTNGSLGIVQGDFAQGLGTSSNNITTVTGTNSFLDVIGNVYLGGGNQSGNQLTILDGAQVAASFLESDVANGNGPGSNNSILISGNASGISSTLSLGLDLTFGSGGQNDTLTISDGATVTNRSAYLDSATNGTSGNTILVTGAGTTWNNGGDLILGQNGSGNLMTISNNAFVGVVGIVSGIVIGQNAGSSSNSLVVTDSSRLTGGLSGTADLFVGYGGNSNNLVISNNSLVAVMGANFGTVIGYSNSASNNSITVTGSSTLTDSGGNWDLFVGYAGSGNSLVISNASTAIYDGTNYGAVIGLSNTANNNSVTVDASSLTINGTNNANLYVGYGGVSNELTISGGGIVTDTNGYIGFTNGANGNSVLVRDSGTLWTNAGELAIGVEGVGNSLIVSNGAAVAVSGGSNGMVIGFSNTANNNLVTVTGSSTLTDNKSGSSIFVGYAGSSNGLVISGDSVVSGGGSSYGTVIGFSNTANNNFITVTGSSTLTDNNYDADLYVGYAGSSNSLTISSNSLVFYTGNNYGTVIGFSNTANNNTLTVSGSSSLTDDGYSDLYVGYDGSSNRLIISSNSLVSQGGYLYGAAIGFSNTANNNAVSVSGNNALLTNGMDLYVGYGGSSNSLAISGGAQVINSNGWIGYTNGSVSNSVMASGMGTLWSNNGTLTVGNSGSGNLTVNNGASVVSVGGIFIASNSGSIGILNIGGLGGTDGAGSITSPSITFGLGSGTINFNQSDSVTISATISGSGAINQYGSGTTILSGNNNYTGTTTITNGTLVLSGTNAGNGGISVTGGLFTGTGVASNSIVTMSGGSITPGSSGSFGTLTVGRLTISGGTLNILLSGTSSSLLSVNGDVTLSGGLLNFDASSLSGSTYTFLSNTNGTITGSFASITNLPTGYQVVYGSNSVYLELNATLGPVTTTFTGTNAVITGGSTNFTVTVTNSAPVGGGDLVFTGTHGTNVSGSVGSTSLAASTATNITGVFAFTGTNVGTNQQGFVTINAPDSTPSSGTGTVTVNVYSHASGSLEGTNLVISNWIAGYTGTANSTNNLTVSNATGQYNVNLAASNNAGGALSVTDVSALGAGSTTLLGASYTATGGEGTGTFSSNVTVTFSDDSLLSGANTNLGTTNISVTGAVYEHASGSLSTNSVAFTNVIVGYSGNLTNSLTVSNATGFRVALATTNDASGAIALANVSNLAAGTASVLSATFANGQGTGTYSSNVNVTYSDDSPLSGATNNLGSYAVTFTANVFDHASNSLSDTNIALSNAIVGYTTSISTNISVTNAAGFRVALNTISTSTNVKLGVSDVTNVAPGASANLGFTLNTNQGVGAFTNAVRVVSADNSSLNGAATNSTNTVTVTGAIYDHASGSLSQSNVTLQAVHVGYTNAQTYQIGVSNAPGFRVSLQSYTTNSSNNLSLTGVSGVDTNTSSNSVLAFVTGQGVGAFTNVIGSVYGDDSPLAGNRAQVGTNYLTVSGLVYSGQGTWTAATGNWTNVANWNQRGGTPGLDGELSTNDSATFGPGVAGSVTLNTNAGLNSIAFNNASNSYTVTGTGTISLVLGVSAPLIEVLEGSHFIENALDLQTNVTFTNASGAQLTVGGNISGNGGISLSGSGTLLLSGNNSYLGGAVVNSGTLSAGSTTALGSGGVQLLGGTLSLATNLTIHSLVWNSSAIVQLLNPTNSIYLTITDAVTLQGSGTNYFDLAGYTPSSSNNPTELLDFGKNALTVNQFGIDNVTGYTLFTNNGALYTYGGSVALIASSSGTTISSTVTYPQVIFQTNGILNVSSSGNLTITTNVVINHDGAINLSGTMTAPNVSVTGGSSLSMLGGTLNGNVASSGSMTISGQSAINGNLQLNGLSSLTIGLGSLLNVSGSATLGGTLIIANPVAFGTKETFLSASSITGAFSSIIAPVGERGRLVIEGDPTASIIIAPASYTQMAQNQNQVNVATALNSFIPYTSGDQLTVSTSLDSLTASEYNQAFNAIMPTFYQQMATIAFNEANALNMELNQRLWGLRLTEGGGFSMSGLADNYPMFQEGPVEGQGDGKGVLDSKKDILRPGADNHWGLFVDGNGIFAQANSANMLPGYNSESGGVTAGVTYRVNPTLSVGAYTGYQGTYTKSGATGSGLGTGSSLSDNAVRFGFFGTYGNKDGKGLYLNALAGGAYHNYQATRVIQYTGVNRTANSQPGAGELDSMLATGYDIQRGKFTFGPTASLQYTYLGVNSLNETGAQSLNYNSGGWNSSSMLSSVGAHAAYNWIAHHGSGGDIVVVPQINLNWQHEFMQNPYDISGNLGGTSPTFSNWSSSPIRDFLYTGIGFTVEFLKKWNTSFFYNAAAGNQNLTSQNIFWSLGSKF
jgi:T5SS/PEP-CTERM-associated repeat protein